MYSIVYDMRGVHTPMYYLAVSQYPGTCIPYACSVSCMVYGGVCTPYRIQHAAAPISSTGLTLCVARTHITHGPLYNLSPMPFLMPFYAFLCLYTYMPECQYTTTLSSFLPGVLGTERAVQLRDELAWLKEQDLMPPNYVQFTTSSGAIKFRKPESKW